MSTGNPYKANVPQSNQGGGGNAADKLKAPGICLIVVGGVGLLVMGGFYALTLVGLAMDPSAGTPPPDIVSEAERTGFFVGFYGALIVPIFNLIAQVLMILGGIAMVRAKSLGMARTGAVVAVIPCLTTLCVLGMPFGIWALIVLADSRVKSCFR